MCESFQDYFPQSHPQNTELRTALILADSIAFIGLYSQCQKVSFYPPTSSEGYSFQCSHSKFKLGVFIPPHFEIRGYEVKFEGMTF